MRPGIRAALNDAKVRISVRFLTVSVFTVDFFSYSGCDYLGQEYASDEQWLSSQDTCRMLTCKVCGGFHGHVGSESDDIRRAVYLTGAVAVW